LSYIYFNYGTIPSIKGVLYGVNAVVIALIGTSLHKMSKKSIGDTKGYIIAATAAGLVYFLKMNVVLVLVLAGILGIFVYYRMPNMKNKLHIFALPVFLGEDVLIRLFGFFMKVGAFIYGGGLVIIPFIEQEVVKNLGWLTQQEFLAGISLGQVTPGPVVITSAFIGYKVMGLLGAFIAALGIFLPSFIFILAAAPYLTKVKSIPWVKGFLKSINAAVIGTILASVIMLIPNAITDLWTLLIALGGFVAIGKFKVNTFYAVGAAGVIGTIITTFVR
jgi:chromate transporter